VDPEIRRELEATVEARHELGAAHDRELIDGFLERIGKEIDRRVDERVARKTATRHGSAINPANLAVCIPIIAIAGGIGGLTGLIVAFLALAFVFVLAETRR